MPSFRLESMEKGWTLTDDNFKGKRVLFIVGRSRKGAVPARKWLTTLRRQGFEKLVRLYTVVVAKKSWYVPKFLVKKEIRKIAPGRLSRYVLIEWREAFAKAFAIPQTDRPHLRLVDKKGIIRWSYEGYVTKSLVRRLRKLLER